MRLTRTVPQEKPAQPANVSAIQATKTSAIFHPDDANLIQFKLRLDSGTIVNALIDTGSELDIISEELCKENQLPVDRTVRRIMRDAGGHDNILHGCCLNVNLSTNGLKTKADLWLADVSFPLTILLGRPWQRLNHISIEERDSGTWLSKRDHKDRRVWEVCVIPSKLATELYATYPSYFFGKDNNLKNSPDILLAPLIKKTLQQADEEETSQESDN
jgi:hypothetical protein